MDMDMELLLSMSHRLTMDMVITLPITPMVTTFTRGLLMLSQDMAMDMVMARGLLMPDTMVVPALMSTRPVLTTMDLMAMVSTTMARGLLMPDILDMEVMDTELELEVTSRSAGHTPTMVSVLPTLTKCQMEIVRQFFFDKFSQRTNKQEKF